MANFSVNQVQHLYVAETLSETSHASTVTNASNAKTIGVNGISENSVKKEMYFVYKGADTVLKSDLIPVANITSIRPIKASAMATIMRKVEITLDSNVNSGAPVAGQDYVLGINFKNFFSSGDASQYYKNAAVHATSGMSASDFYKKMVEELNKAFAREDGATASSNPYLAFSWKPNGTTATQADAIVIEEKPQEWALGTKKARRIMFDILFSTIYTAGDDFIWGVATNVSGGQSVNNGQKIADLEWFCMGERGDQYRNVGWPNVIPTKYLVDSTKEYSLIEIHYAFTDTGVNSYRTEKDMTIAVPNGTGASKYTVINSIIDEIEYHTGMTISGLSD